MRLRCLLLAALLLLPLWGCSKNNMAHPVNYYYLQKDALSDTSSNVIAAEVRDGAAHREQWVYLLGSYLRGPISYSYTNPFPSLLQLRKADLQGDHLYLTLSEHLADLSGLDLTLACACLALTGMELTGAESVEIQAEGRLLNGKRVLVLNRDDIELLDTQSVPGIPEE